MSVVLALFSIHNLNLIADRCFPVPVANIANVDPAFLEHCLSVARDPMKFAIKATPPDFDRPDTDPERSRLDGLVDNYADAFIDTYGTVSGAPFVYKTGPAWPKKFGPEAWPYVREIRPIHDHPITSSWPEILKKAEAYLKGRGTQYTAIMGFSWSNAGEETPFCPLLVTIGVEPMTATFEEARTDADYVKSAILDQAGFPDIEVAIWEWATRLSNRGPKLPSLDPLFERATTEFKHPFASTLGLGIALRKQPHYEGTAGLYLRRGSGSSSDDVLALTAAHVVRPPPVFPNDSGLSHKTSSRHRGEIITLGNKGFADCITEIQCRIGTLLENIAEEEEDITRLEQLQANGGRDADEIAMALEAARWAVCSAAIDIPQLVELHDHVTESMLTPNKRIIGNLLHADPVSASSDGPDRFTIDWAVIQLNKDAFNWDDFKGNKVYIGGKIDQPSYRNLMFPNDADQAGYKYPEYGLLQISGTVPESEIHQPTQLNAYGDPAMPVIKNGMATGTTVGWVNGLKSLVRHYDFCKTEFTSLETTIVPYGGGRGAFSDDGDSGSIILDRKGRIVGLLTGGGGRANETDVTFATAWYDLEPHIKKALPGVHLY